MFRMFIFFLMKFLSPDEWNAFKKGLVVSDRVSKNLGF